MRRTCRSCPRLSLFQCEGSTVVIPSLASSVHRRADGIPWLCFSYGKIPVLPFLRVLLAFLKHTVFSSTLSCQLLCQSHAVFFWRLPSHIVLCYAAVRTVTNLSPFPFVSSLTSPPAPLAGMTGLCFSLFLSIHDFGQLTAFPSRVLSWSVHLAISTVHS